MTETDTASPPTDNGTVLASIAGMLDEHRANIAAHFKSTFAALESRLDRIQTTITEHGQRMDSLESHNKTNKFKPWRRGVQH